MGIWGIIFGLVCVGVGGFLAVAILFNLRRAKQSEAWPQVTGKVLTSVVVEKDNDNVYQAGHLADICQK